MSNREFFSDLPNTDTPIRASRLNGLLNGNEAMGSIVVDDINCKNLFNPGLVTFDKYVDASDGLLATYSGVFATDFIEIEPETDYYWNDTILRPNTGAFYDSSKTYISGIASPSTHDFTTPSTAKYVRLTGTTTNINQYQLEIGNTATEYVPYNQPVKNMGGYVKENATFYANDFKCRNLFPVTTISTQSVYCCPCKKGVKYTLSFEGYGTSSDKRIFLRTYNGAFNSSIDNSADNVQMVLTSSNEEYVKTITPTIDGYIYIRFASGPANYVVNNIQLEEGEQTGYTKSISSDGLYNYNEIRIGTWIDGKPIYRKVIDLGYMPNNTEKTVAHNISNISTFVSVRAIAQTAGPVSLTLPNYNGSIYSNLYANATNVIIQTNGDRSSFTGYAILEYTKTMD